MTCTSGPIISQANVRTVLRRDWDPIGLGEQGPDNEYDSHSNAVFAMLRSGIASELVIAGYLYRAETVAMELTGSSEAYQRCQVVAKKLMALRRDAADR